jgi:TonB-linked SusC/RagA family outer membrane protein
MIKKLKLFCLTLAFSFSFIATFPQTKPIPSYQLKINLKEKNIAEIFRAVENQTNLKFSYDQSEITLNQKLSVNFEGNLADFLTFLTSKSNLDFKLVGKSISVRNTSTVNLPVRIITGIVRDKTDGQTIPGANIFIKGTKKGAVTNVNGEFTYKITNENIKDVVLVVSFLGMRNKEVKIGNQSFLKIDLEFDAIGMNEVLVTSSYTKDRRREDVVGSISQLSAAQLQTDRPIESFDKMMEGLIAGVQVETNTELGTPVKVNIRGQGSLPAFGSTNRATTTTSTQPLYVLDGVPMYEQQKRNENSAFGREQTLNPLSSINPDDIKSISVLKDATASALYGANAANGVIIITTKSGAAGKTKVNFSYDAGVATFMNEFKWLSGPEYYSLLRETYINEGRSVTLASQIAGSKTTDTDWFDLTNRNANYQNANLDISGGNSETTFRFSAGYRNQQASSLRNDLQKTYLRLRLDHKISNKFTVGLSLSPTVTNKNSLSNYGGVLLPPNISPYNEDGSFTVIQGVPNPLAVLAQNDDYHKGLQLNGNINAKYNITDALSVSGTLGADFYQNKEIAYLSASNQTGATRNGFLEIYDRNYNGYIGFVQATYDKIFNQKHAVNFVLGTQLEDKTTYLLGGQGTGFSFDRLRVLSSSSTQRSFSSKSEDANVSYYSQLGYDLFKKYYANVNARIDESSVFGGDKQVALNGSLGFGWVISKENFLKDSKAINLLKLRATYGSTGNSRIGTYSARGLYDFGTSSGNFYNGNIGSVPDGSSAPNPNLGWEKNFKFNLGLDITLFNRVQLTAEYYNNTIKDLISSVNVPLETGFSTILANTSKMRNEGLELTINTENIRKSNFSWSTSFNLGSNKNKILSFNNGFAALYASSDEAAGFKVGNSSSAIYGYKWAGVDPQTGLEMFYDNNGNKLDARAINALPISETIILGDRLPDFQGGFVNNLTVYNFSLAFNILYSYGADIKYSFADESDGRNLQNRNQSVNLLDRWQRPGDITTIPKPSITRVMVTNSSRYIMNVSYLKLSNVSLNYKLPNKIAEKLRLNNASIFSNVTNLFYLYTDAGTKGRNGIAEKRFIYPETRAFTGGLRIGL